MCIRDRGIAFPGLVNNKKSIIISTNEKDDDGVELDLDRWAEEHWGAPFYIDNDARLAAIGEWQYGSGRGYDSVVMMTIGTVSYTHLSRVPPSCQA